MAPTEQADRLTQLRAQLAEANKHASDLWINGGESSALAAEQESPVNASRYHQAAARYVSQAKHWQRLAHELQAEIDKLAPADRGLTAQQRAAMDETAGCLEAA